MAGVTAIVVPATGPRTPEALQHITKARTDQGGYSAESRRVATMSGT
jgi:hypothetical protein